MQLPWGGLQSEAIGAWDELARQVRDARGHRDHQPRDPRHRVAGADRPGARVARPRRRHRGAPRAVGPRPGPPDPRGVAGERQAPRPAALRRLPRPDPRPRAGHAGSGRGSGACRRSPTSSTAGARTCRPQQVHLVTVPPPGGAPELLWKRFSQAFGLDGIDLDLEGERHNPSLGVPETTLLRRINRKANAELAPGRLPAAGPRAAGPPDPVPAHAARRAWRCRRTCTRGSRSCRRRGSPRSRRRGYDVVGDLGDLVGAPPVAEYADPDRPRRAPGRRRGRRRDHRAAPRQRAAAPRGGAAARRARRRARRARARPRDAVVPPPARARACGWRTAASAARCSGSTGGRGAGARGRRSGRPSTWRRRPRPARRSHPRSGSGGRR